MTKPRLPLLFTLLVLLNLHSIAAIHSGDAPTESSGLEYIRTNCNSTSYPEVCYTSLSRYASTVQSDPAKLAQVAISVSLTHVRQIAAYVSNLTRESDFGNNTIVSAAIGDCSETLGYAVYRTGDSLKRMRGIGGPGFKFQIDNVLSWMSGALTDEDTCTEGFEGVPDGDETKKNVCDGVNDVKKFTSNALALVNNYAKGTP